MIDKMKAYEENLKTYADNFERRQSMDMLLCENSHMAELLEEAISMLSALVEGCTTGTVGMDGKHKGVKMPPKDVVDMARAFLAKAKKVEL